MEGQQVVQSGQEDRLVASDNGAAAVRQRQEPEPDRNKQAVISCLIGAVTTLLLITLLSSIYSAAFAGQKPLKSAVVHGMPKFMTEQQPLASHVYTKPPTESTSSVTTTTATSSTAFGDTIWVYSTEPAQNYSFGMTQHYNHHYYASTSGYKIKHITENTYHAYLPPNKVEALKGLIRKFQGYVSDKVILKDKPKMEEFGRVLFRKVIALHVLEFNGGIMLDENLKLVEDLSWLEDIDRNPYVNRHDRSIPTEVVGFFIHQISSEKHRYNTSEATNEPFKMVRPEPSMQAEFIAAKKGAQLISELCDELRVALNDGKELLHYFQHQGYIAHPGVEIAYISNRIIKRHQANEASKGRLAVDRLGLSLINQLYGPEKVSTQLMQFRDPKIRFQYLADLPLQQLEEVFGPVRYVMAFKQEASLINIEFQRVIYGDRKVMNGSLVHKLVFPNLTSNWLYQNLELDTVNSGAPEWDNLPRRVWTVWLTGYESAPITNKVAFAVIKKRFESRGYSVHLVDLQNAIDYLDNGTIADLHRLVNNKKFPRFPTTMSDLLRLQLLTKHGGVYIDMSIFLQEDVDWINKVARLPSHLIFNKFSPLPKALMSYSFYQPHPGFWQVNEQTRTKQINMANMENSLIVAEKGNPFLTQSLAYFKEALVSSWSKLLKDMKEVGIEQHSTLFENNLYLLEMGAMRYVLGRKQMELNRQNTGNFVNAAHFYGLWFFQANAGPGKFWSGNSFDDLNFDTTSFYTEYSKEYSDGLFGKPVIPYFKVLGSQTDDLNKRRLKEYSQRSEVVSDELHPKSPIRQVMDEFSLTIRKQGDKLVLVQGKQ